MFSRNSKHCFSNTFNQRNLTSATNQNCSSRKKTASTNFFKIFINEFENIRKPRFNNFVKLLFRVRLKLHCTNFYILCFFRADSKPKSYVFSNIERANPKHMERGERVIFKHCNRNGFGSNINNGATKVSL